MTESIGAPSGADVSSASSSAPTTTNTPASAGPPSRNSIAASLKAKKSEVSKEPASPKDTPQTDGAPRADDSAQKTEGDTASLEAGKGEQKPTEKSKEPESVPLAVLKELRGKERERREKLETDLTAAKTSEAKVRAVLDAALAENERLTEALQNGTAFDERGEELQSLKLQQQVKERLAQVEQEHAQALQSMRYESEVNATVTQLRSEVAAAVEAFPLVSAAEVRAALRANPSADVRQLAQVEHEKRMAYISKQNETRGGSSDLPTTVAKPSGVQRFEAHLSAKGLAQAFKHSRAKG
jgi:hypothetical protein